MKDLQSSKSASIRYGSELEFHFREFLADDPDLHWHLLPSEGTHRDNTLELDLDGKRLVFAIQYELKPSLPWVVDLAHKGIASPLLVTPQLSPRILAFCKQHGIAAMDLNGRAWLRAPGLLVNRGPLPGRSFSFELEPRNIFVGKSARIVRCLLTDHVRLWTQAEIVNRTHASSGLVSRIVQYLISQGFVEKTSAREFRLGDYLGLVGAWADADKFINRAQTTRYAGFIGHPEELAHRLQEWAESESVSIAFTQWIAAWFRHPYTEPVLTSAYVSRLPEAATLDRLGLRPVSDGGKLWLHVPDDEGIFFETQTRQGLTLTTDAQIYLDLQQSGLRGPEQADALRNGEDFCKP